MAQAVRNALSRGSVNLGSTSDITAMGVAKSIAYSLPIPAGAVKNPRTYFLEQNGVLVSDRVSDINECLVVDVKKVQDLAYRIWTVRYNVVHNCKSVKISNLLSLSHESPVPTQCYVKLNEVEQGVVENISDIITRRE